MGTPGRLSSRRLTLIGEPSAVRLARIPDASNLGSALAPLIEVQAVIAAKPVRGDEHPSVHHAVHTISAMVRMGQSGNDTIDRSAPKMGPSTNPCRFRGNGRVVRSRLKSPLRAELPAPQFIAKRNEDIVVQEVLFAVRGTRYGTTP